MSKAALRAPDHYKSSAIEIMLVGLFANPILVLWSPVEA